MGPRTVGIGAALQPPQLRGVWHRFPARFGSSSKQPGVQENVPGWVEEGGDATSSFHLLSLYPGKAFGWCREQNRPWAGSGRWLSPREWAPSVPPGGRTPLVTASWVALACPCIPGPTPVPDGRLGMVPPPLARHSTAQQPPHPPSHPYLKAGSGTLSQPRKYPRCFSQWFSHQQQVFLLFPGAVFPPGRV